MEKRLERRARRERRKRLKLMGTSVTLALLLMAFLAGTLSAQEQEQPVGADRIDLDDTGSEPEELMPPDLAITKNVDDTTAPAGAVLEYTVVMANTGDGPAVDVVMTDTLPAEVTYEDGSLTVNGGGLWGTNGLVITWTGNIMNGSQVVVSFEAQIDEEALPGTTIENTVDMAWDGNDYSATATTTVVEVTASTTNYLPLIFSPPPDPPGAPVLSVSLPNFDNQWLAAWTPSAGATSYELQESVTPDFSSPTTYDTAATSQELQHSLGLNNEYFYRVRALNQWGTSDWSNVVSVIAGYRDDFTDGINNWSIRRTTFIDETDVFHEVMNGEGLLILRVEDSWDWAIASPMVKAPSPPYVIEYRAQVANTGNLVSHGMAFGADWPGEICPDWNTLPGVYEHSLCFNHFYLANNIYYGEMKMLFERVDFLSWCPGCGGSPMKRLSNDYSTWFTVEPVNPADPEEFNVWRYEVRNSGIQFYVNGVQYASSPDTLWINEPYFGVFGSTDEYSNSTTRFDYVEVRPLDD